MQTVLRLMAWDSEDTRLTPGVYVLPRGLRIAADGVTPDATGATLVGTGQGIAVHVEAARRNSAGYPRCVTPGYRADTATIS